MSSSETKINLLSPAESFRDNYIRQLQRTIEAYSSSMIVLGEAIQNSIDAVCEAKNTINKGKINVEINFDSETVIITDNGVGFPNDISLLYLGGGTKSEKKLKGKVGVGIKVTLFCSDKFCLRSRGKDYTFKVNLDNAYQFEKLANLDVTSPLPDDQAPLEENGTQVTYSFPKARNGQSYLDDFFQEILPKAIPDGVNKNFGKTIQEYQTKFPSPFSALLASFLQRYSYVGDVLAAYNRQDRYPKDGIDITFTISCENPVERFQSEEVGILFGNEATQSFTVNPSYFGVKDSLLWVPRGKKKPNLFFDKLGDGGKNLERTNGFNQIIFTTPDEYESLVKNTKGHLPPKIEEYKKKLFTKINAIELTIGKIPDFDNFLPGGSRRVISCNGVLTNHDIDFTRGRNQQYVRCFDLIVDVDSQLNYGKTHLTDSRLVGLVRDYINDAYASVIQNAAGAWVGTLPEDGYDEDAETFLDKEDLGLQAYTTRKVPRDENDVIGLFFEMAGRGLFPDYRIFGLSQKNRYDCGAAIKRERDSEEVLEPKDGSKLRIVEFKVYAAEVIRDFDRNQKFSREIDLVIAWDEGGYESRNYSIYDIDQSEAYKKSPKAVFPKVDKYIYDAKTGAEVQVLLLKNLVDELK